MSRLLMMGFAVLLVSGLSLGLVATAADQPAAAEAEAAKTGAAVDTELAKHMEELQDHLKKLRRTLRKAEDNAESLQHIDKALEELVECKALIPAKAANVPEAERAQFVNGYRKDMVAVIMDLCQMELAVLEGNNDRAQEIHKGLKTKEDEGHEKYIDE